MGIHVRVSGRAESDADAIYRWIAERAPEGALRWYEAYLSTLRNLPLTADGCGMAPESERLAIELRQILFKTRKGQVYRAMFVILDQTAHVVAVRGAGQDLATLDDLELPE